MIWNNHGHYRYVTYLSQYYFLYVSAVIVLWKSMENNRNSLNYPHLNHENCTWSKCPIEIKKRNWIKIIFINLLDNGVNVMSLNLHKTFQEFPSRLIKVVKCLVLMGHSQYCLSKSILTMLTSSIPLNLKSKILQKQKGLLLT